VKQLWTFKCGKDCEKLAPDHLFLGAVICPQRSLNARIAIGVPQANEIVEVAVGHSFHVEVDRSATAVHGWRACDVDRFLSDCQGFQGVAILDGIRFGPS
jgi:hypothetical protein